MVEVDSGAEVIKIGYSSNRNENDKHTVNLNVKLRDLVCKSKKWPKYDTAVKERIYEVVRGDGTVFTTFKRPDLYTFTLGQLLEMMNFQGQPKTMLSYSNHVWIKIHL